MNRLKKLSLQIRTLIVAVVINFGSIGALAYANQTPPPSKPITVAAAPVLPEAAIEGVPVAISVPSLGLQLKIEPGVYEPATDSWTLSGYNGHFATITSPANNSAGNTFIYGHNNKNVFGPLKGLLIGSEVEVTTDNGNRFYYNLSTSKTVLPTNVSIFNYAGAPILTIQTCVGTFNEQRELYQFSFDHVIESGASIAARTEAQRVATIELISASMSPDITLIQTAAQPTPPAPATVQPIPETSPIVEPTSTDKTTSDSEEAKPLIDRLLLLTETDKPFFSRW